MSLSIKRIRLCSFVTTFVISSLAAPGLYSESSSSVSKEELDVNNWLMQDAAKVHAGAGIVSSASFTTEGWYKATVPGTVLTTLVDNHVYPEPLYGENLRPSVIPDSLSQTPFWYRSEMKIPKSYAGRHVWLNFDGVNYAADVWVNGKHIGDVRGAFCRGKFDITEAVQPGGRAIIGVRIEPEPNAGVPHEHTLRNGVGANGGLTALDGPTFLSTIGWDWMPAIPGRDMGLWRKVWLSTSGDVILENPQVTSDLKVPGLETADLTVKATLRNLNAETREGVLKGSFGGVTFERAIVLPAHASKEIVFSAASDPALHLEHPKLWWPNGYGPQNLYQLQLELSSDHVTSQREEVSFGVRKITYTVSSTDALAFVVNGVPIFIRGGDWGLDDALKRIPYDRLDAEIQMHKLANLNMIRNWVGQSTSEDFFALCDKYGLLVWDEFFQPNPNDGPDPTDLKIYMSNVRDTVLRYRNHPSIVIWCARNEGNPPADIDHALSAMLADLDSTRLYQANSSDGRSIRSHGPYRWRVPRDYYWINEGFKSETGSMSVPTIESIQNMMPEKDWDTINDDWAEHDFAAGAVSGDLYPDVLAARYGKILNLADFVRKSQLANYEAFRAMYEGRNAQMFHPTTGVMTWMSHPSHPSFVWQLYHYDLEPNSSFFAVKKASEMVHVQLNEVTGMVQAVNNLPEAIVGGRVQAQVFNMDGKLSSEQTFTGTIHGSSVKDLGEVNFHEPLTRVFFVRLKLVAKDGHVLSENLYWLNHPERADMLSDLDGMPPVDLQASMARTEGNGVSTLSVKLHNPSSHIALMVHLQLRIGRTRARILPAMYSDNYVSLMGGEDKEVEIQCAASDLKDDKALVVLDGWNVTVKAETGDRVAVETNENAMVDHWPKTGLPIRK